MKHYTNETIKHVSRTGIILLAGIVLISHATSVFAISKTPTSTPEKLKNLTPTTIKSEPTATEEADLNRIQKIKDMVASRVAELKLVEKRGILGIVKETSSSQVTIKDKKNEQRIIDIDELTKFQGKTSSSSTSKTDDSDSFGISDIKVGDEVAFIGLYNKQTDRLLARIVLLPKSIPTYIDGVVGNVNTDDYTFEVSNDNEKRVIDFEKSTTAQLYTKADGTKKTGFTGIEDGQRALVVGFEDEKNKHIIATRILVFTDVPPSAEMKKGLSLKAPEASASAEVTPTKKVIK